MGWVHIEGRDAGGQNTGTTSNLTVNIPTSPAAGNNCFLAIGWSPNVGTAINSVTDNLGGTWTRVATGSAQSFIIVDLYYRENVPSGLTSVTINGNGTLYLSATYTEFAGGATSNSLDSSVTGGSLTASGQLITAGPFTPAQDEELIFVLGGDDSGNFVETAGAGFTLLLQWAGAGSKSNLYFEYQVLFGKPTVTCTFGSVSPRAPWAAFGVGFKVAPDVITEQLNYSLVG